MTPPARRQSLFSHQTRHPLAGDRDAPLPAIQHECVGSHTPADRTGRLLECALRSGGLPVDAHSLDASSSHSSHSATPQVSRHPHTDRILLAIVFHHLVPHSWPCEKILTVFFRISRSWRVLSSSRFR